MTRQAWADAAGIMLATYLLIGAGYGLLDLGAHILRAAGH